MFIGDLSGEAREEGEDEMHGESVVSLVQQHLLLITRKLALRRHGFFVKLFDDMIHIVLLLFCGK